MECQPEPKSPLDALADLMGVPVVKDYDGSAAILGRGLNSIHQFGNRFIVLASQEDRVGYSVAATLLATAGCVPLKELETEGVWLLHGLPWPEKAELIAAALDIGA